MKTSKAWQAHQNNKITFRQYERIVAGKAVLKEEVNRTAFVKATMRNAYKYLDLELDEQAFSNFDSIETEYYELLGFGYNKKNDVALAVADILGDFINNAYDKRYPTTPAFRN